MDHEKHTRIVQERIHNLCAKYEPSRPEDDKRFLKETTKNLDAFLEQRDDLFDMAKFPVAFTGFTIGACMAFLALTDQLNRKGCLLVIVTLAALFSVYSLFRAAFKSLEAVIRVE